MAEQATGDPVACATCGNPIDGKAINGIEGPRCSACNKARNFAAQPMYVRVGDIEKSSLSVRDYLAALAMSGMIRGVQMSEGLIPLVAQRSYKIADALIAEREK